jgi:hypothetical protein
MHDMHAMAGPLPPSTQGQTRECRGGDDVVRVLPGDGAGGVRG